MEGILSSPTRRYRHTVYVLHPVETRFPKFSRPTACCVHNNVVTDYVLWAMYWREHAPHGVEYCWNSMELLCEHVPYHELADTVDDATRDVENSCAAGKGKELPLNKAVLDRAYGLEGTRAGERWDLYTVDVLTDWPKTLYDPEPDNGARCVVI